MEKPTPITKEYVDYLNSLSPEILVEKAKDLTKDDKTAIAKILYVAPDEKNKTFLNRRREFNMFGLRITFWGKDNVKFSYKKTKTGFVSRFFIWFFVFEWVKNN